MREIKVDTLKPLPKLPVPVLHKSGIPLLQAGEEMNAAIVAAFKKAGLVTLFVPDPDEKLEVVQRNLTHVSMPIDQLTPGDKLNRTIFDDGGQLLLEEGTPVPKSFADSMRRRNIDKIYFRKPQEVIEPKAGRKLRAKIEELLKGETPKIADPKTLEEFGKIELKEANPDDLNEDAFRNKIDKLDKIDVTPQGEAFLESIRDTRKEGPASAEEKQAFSSAIDESLAMVAEIYTTLADSKGKVALPGIEDVATRAMAGMIQNRELLLLLGTGSSDAEYSANHSLAMTVIAVNVGTTLGYDAAQIKSLAYGAMLADVGMLKVPEHILNKSGKLTPSEYAEIKRHPSFGLDMLQRIQHIPEEVPYIVYQSHERANGTGYPCGKKDVVIHPFAKIVSVADIYTSVCSERPYREGKMPYEAMEQLVLMCGKRLLNADIVRAFLACNSMFPVGSFVRLSDGRAGRVVAANPENYMKPLISLLVSENGKPMSNPQRLDLLEHEDITVTQALNAGDLSIGDDPMIGF